MTAPIDEARLARIEEWASDHATRCYACDAVARVVIPGTSRALCAACAPNVPGAVLPLVSAYATALDLVAEVRRLTDALAAHQGHTDAAVDGVRAMLPEALANARCDGAMAMRERAARVIRAHRKVRTDREEALRAEGVPQGDPAYLCLATAVVSLDRALAEVEALPLDAPTTEGASS